MKKLPSLKQLQHLIALYEFQHFGRAAEACYISQSTLSASILQLEDVLNTSLLEREHKNFVFTSVGKETVMRSRSIIEKAVSLVEYAKDQEGLMQGDFYLGCIPTIAPFICGELLSTSCKEFPKLKLLLREDTSANLLKQLAEGTLDCIILALPYPALGVETQLIVRDYFHKVWLKYDKSEGLNSPIFLLEKEHCLSYHAIETCHLKNQNIHPFYATSLQTLVQMVEFSQGATYLPQLAINSGILLGTSLMSKPLHKEKAYRELGIAWRPTSSKKETYKLFATLLEKILKNKLSL